MHNCKLTLVLALGLALTIGGLTGCASKKKAPAQPVQETKAPEQKAAPAPVVKEAPKQIEEDVREVITIMRPTNRFILHPVDSIFPDTPWSGIEAVIKAWKLYR